MLFYLQHYCANVFCFYLIIFSDKPSFEMPSNTSSDEMKSQWLLSLPIQNFKYVFGMSKVFLRCVVSDSSMF